MTASRRTRAVVAGLLAGSLGTRVAQADSAGYQLDRYEPSPAGDAFSVVEFPWYSATRALAAALTFEYAHRLVGTQFRDTNGNLVDGPDPISGHQAADLSLAYSPLSRLGLSLNVPLVLSENGTPYADVRPSGTTLGDPRVGLRVRMTDRLGLSGYAWIPVGVNDSHAGDAGVRGLVRVTASSLLGERLRWAVNGGFLARPRATLSATTAPGGNTVGSEVQVGAAAAYSLGKLAIGPEAVVGVSVIDLPAGQKRTTAEAYLTARYAIDDRLSLAVGAGGGVTGTGVPDVRAIVSLIYAPTRNHAPTSSFERVVVLPDENGHIGGVEVHAGKQVTVLDKPYASTELTKRDRAPRAVQSDAKVAAKATATVQATLPPADRDRDGIIDLQDGCPERAGVASSDPVRNGCPAAVEKIVVLPDADGHVGGVEVDDGKTKTLLDKPYASAEVTSDGEVRAIPPAPPKAVERTVATVAQTLPPPDADEDGIVDHEDACPDRAGVASADPIRHGCPAAAEKIIVMPDPDGHIGGVDVDDGKTKILLDSAYASAEIGADGVARAVPPGPARSIERAISAIAQTLPISDGDKDNIRDEQDACPDRAGAASADPFRNGCPAVAEKVIVLPDADGHVGGVEVDDGKTKVVLDAAYASSEVVGTGVTAVGTAPPGAMTRAAAALAATLPLPDRDDDGIVDSADACPTRAGRASPQASRHGCPVTVEQVVVLADENGHVGAVEVDDGTSKTLVDQAYGAAEVGADGIARGLPVEATEVSARYGAAMAAQPAGARIILYFNQRAEPVRDLTGPIDNLVAELKSRADYKLEVIGHTDQTGSEKANQKIGLERAQLIADRLVAAGVAKDRITVKSMGSKEPAVKLKSRRVVELRNRRVEIWVK